MLNPQAYQEYQKAKNDGVDPNEYLNQITNGFSPERKDQWEQLINEINVKK